MDPYCPGWAPLETVVAEVGNQMALSAHVSVKVDGASHNHVARLEEMIQFHFRCLESTHSLGSTLAAAVWKYMEKVAQSVFCVMFVIIVYTAKSGMLLYKDTHSDSSVDSGCVIRCLNGPVRRVRAYF